MNDTEIDKIKSLLSEKKDIVIIPHKNPDGDAIGASTGLRFYLDNFNYRKINVRLLGIDTPELRGSEKELGIKARNYLIKILTDVIIDKDYSRNEIRDLIFNKNNNIVDILFDDFDKYGRPLGIIYKNNINIKNGESLWMKK